MDRALPDYADKFADLERELPAPAAKMQELAQDQGIDVVYMPGRPADRVQPDKVKQPPTTPQELLAWAKANPKRFLYARPANSGPGRTFLMGLPYLLGDKDPKDPATAGTRPGRT